MSEEQPWKAVAGGRTFVKYKDCEDGDVLVVGEYVREYQNKNFGGTQWDFRCEETGQIITLNHAGSLAYKLQFIKPGARVKIVYRGLDYEFEKMGNHPHKFDVFEAKGSAKEEAPSDDDLDDAFLGD